MRWAAYAGVSATLAAGVLVKALSERPNFYSATVYLAHSSANLMILTNFAFLCACVTLFWLQKLLYGPLRPIEIEALYERAWLFVTETCLSMTIFRGSFGAWFMVMFFSLLAGKVWSWIGEGRVEILDQQPPPNPRLFHTRLAISLSLSVLFATYMLDFSIRTVLAQAKPDMMVMFGFEFAILTILVVSTAARYVISLTEIFILRKQKIARRNELRAERVAAHLASDSAGQGTSSSSSNEPAANGDPDDADDADVEVEGWEGKGRWIFYLDLVTDFLKLTVYVAFFSVLMGFYGLPLHIMRDLFLSFRSFFKRVADFVRYRNATRDMNARYPDATAEEVAREEVCIICREEMRPVPVTQSNSVEGAPPRTNLVAERMRPKKLPCGHILHFSCLRSWLERQQNCPTCRRPVIVPQRMQGEAADRHALPGDVAGQPGGQAIPGNEPHHPGRDRARIINFGPIRIGFGAGGGQLIEDLAQRLHNGEQRPPAEAPGNVRAPQHFGFGFGFGRRPNPTNANQTASNMAPIQAQLDHIEHSLQQQISGLRVATNQLQLVRMLNNELLRLRNSQATNPNHEAAMPPSSTAVSASPAPFGPGQPPPTGHQPPSIILSSHAHQPLSFVSSGLPEGLTLPPGWTLMPLQRYDGPTRPWTTGSGTNLTQSATNGVPTAAQPTGITPQTHPSTESSAPSSSRSPPVPAALNGTHPASPAATADDANPGLPSSGSAPAHTNGEGSVERHDDASPSGGGPSHPEEAVQRTGGRGEKRKATAPMVEDEVDDVD